MLNLVAMQPLRPEEAAEERVREGGGAIVTSDHKDTKTTPTMNSSAINHPIQLHLNVLCSSMGCIY
jgi:hypothetical protein